MAPRERQLLLAGSAVLLALLITCHRIFLVAPKSQRRPASRTSLIIPHLEPTELLVPSTPQLPRQTSMPILATCSRYAGPLRWRQHPGGRGAPEQQLRLLPIPAGGRLEEGSTLGPRRRRRLVPFAPSALELLPGGPFADASLTNAQFLASLSIDRLLWSFRQTAGVPQPAHARPYGGWESPGAGIRGHFVGHWLAGAALAAAAGGSGGAGPELGGALAEASRSAVSTLAECARAHTAAGRKGYLAAFPVLEFEKSEGLGCAAPDKCNIWVPHYATQKVLSGLLMQHEALGTPGALPLALGMAEWVYDRARLSRRRHGEAHWTEGLNYEVGALSEVYVLLARTTRNATWLDAAALFDRRCFTGALAYANELHSPRPDRHSQIPHDAARFAQDSEASTSALDAGLTGFGAEDEPAVHEPQSKEEMVVADGAFTGMHANAQMAYILGAAELFLTSGEERARGASEAFWRELQRAYVYLTGGSSFQEEWRAPVDMVANSLQHRGERNWVAHDHQESCVTHNAMILSTKMMRWHNAAAHGIHDSPRALRSLLSLCDWFERALYNSVLGTQRGVQPGALLYMMPLGGGVSKAGGAKRWSDTEHHFWCCMGSAVEAFARLHHAVWWTAPSQSAPTSVAGDLGLPAMYILQLVPSVVRWARAGLALRLEGDVPGEIVVVDGLTDPPLTLTISASRLIEPHTSARMPSTMVDVCIRVPNWARAAHAFMVAEKEKQDGLLPRPQAGSMLRARLTGGASLRLHLWPRLSLRRVAPNSELHGLFYGPLLLAALTDGDRRFFAPLSAAPETWAAPVPTSARTSLRTIELACPCADESPIGSPDESSDFVLSYAAEEAGHFSNGGDRPRRMIELTAEPLVLPTRKARKGGSDGTSRASWRLAPAPATARGGTAVIADARQPLYLEAMDRPGMVVGVFGDSLEALRNDGMPLELLHADNQPPLAKMESKSGDVKLLLRWWLRPIDEQPSCTCTKSRKDRVHEQTPHGPKDSAGVVDLQLFALESADAPGTWVVADQAALPPSRPPAKRKASKRQAGRRLILRGPAREAESRGRPPRNALLFRLAAARASYPPVAYWALSNISASPSCASTQYHKRDPSCVRARGAYLMVPLNELLDEHYSPFLCMLGGDNSQQVQVPKWCA